MELEPPWKKRKTTDPPPPPPSLLSLPDVLILNCLARVSKSYYPKLSLVSKTFRTLILSLDLNHARFHHKTQETFLHLCLQLPDDPSRPSWFTLWINPDDQIENDNDKKKKNKKMSTLVKAPSSYASCEPLFLVTVGSDIYALIQNFTRSTQLLVRNKDSCLWRRAPGMSVARAYPVACLLDEKIYVMGGCSQGTWGEVFDIKTQTWQPLPDPSPELRFSSVIRRIDIIQKKIFIRSNEEQDSSYDPKKGIWKVAPKTSTSESCCMVGNIWYSCRTKSILWLDKEINQMVVVRGLSSLNKSCRRGLIHTANYNGKLLLLWDKFAEPGRRCQDKSICCALVSLEKRQNGQVWGKVEWSNVVLTVPKSYAFLRSSMVRC